MRASAAHSQAFQIDTDPVRGYPAGLQVAVCQALQHARKPSRADTDRGRWFPLS